MPACSTIFWHASESAIANPMVAFDSSLRRSLRMWAARSWIRPTTWCTSSETLTGVTSSRWSASSLAGTRGTLPWISKRSAACRKNPARAQYRRTSSDAGTVKSGFSRWASRSACAAVSIATSP